MLRRTPLATTVLIALSLFAACWTSAAEIPTAFKIDGVPRVKQLTNYCGPACIESVARYYGAKITQAEIGREIYSGSDGATNGADMLLYARENGCLPSLRIKVVS